MSSRTPSNPCRTKTTGARHGSRWSSSTRCSTELSNCPAQGFVERTVSPDAEAIYTDELRSYIGVETDTRRHETVRHSADEWLVGDVHTNSAEGVWSLFKRSIVGSFHKMSVKHMDRYLEELEWRFNNRNNPWIFRDTLRRIVQTDPIHYRELIA